MLQFSFLPEMRGAEIGCETGLLRELKRMCYTVFVLQKHSGDAVDMELALWLVGDEPGGCFDSRFPIINSPDEQSAVC